MIGLSLNSKLVQNEQKPILIKKQCDNSHKHCHEIIQYIYKFPHMLDETYFNEFIQLTSSQHHYTCCMSSNYNTKHMEVKRFILLNSKKYKINKFDNIFVFMSDIDLYELIINQQLLCSELINNIINTDTNYNYSKSNLLNVLISSTIKSKTFEHLIKSMTLEQFGKYLDKMIITNSSVIDDIIIEFILQNKTNLTQNKYCHIGLKILNKFISKPNIIINIYPLITNNLAQEQKKEILNKSISTHNKNLILLMLEKKDVIPDINTINKLVEKSYARHEGATNSKLIADIIDMLCDYGLVINKQIIIKLLEHGCYVNNLEKHDISVDNEILAKCADISYYPYKFDIIPNTDILMKECSKHDNLITIKKLKEFGGKFTSECLEEACKIPKNSRTLKYLITECKINVTDNCLEKFQNAYKIEALDTILKHYISQNPTKKINNNINEKKNIEINNESLMKVTPRNINIDIKNNVIEYNLKNKVTKFFQLKKKTMKYFELHELFLRYLITNKLVIGKYFVINIELSNLLKINHCVIMDISQIHNILTYFIDLPTINLPVKNSTI